MNLKQKILTFIYEKNPSFFKKQVLSTFSNTIDLEKLYEEHKLVFNHLLVKDFTGYIPKDIREPVLKVFEDHGELLERWTLWQSWYINRKAINDQEKLEFYHGMMVYLKVINTMASVNKKLAPIGASKPIDTKVEIPWVQKALEGVEDFKSMGVKKDESDKSTEDKDS